jgi:hypothetical protein
MLAILVYLAAIGIPIYLLYRFGAQSWYWHILALAAGIGLGFVTIPAQFQGPVYDMSFGFVFINLLIWGAGGIIFIHSQPHAHGRHAKHA